MQGITCVCDHGHIGIVSWFRGNASLPKPSNDSKRHCYAANLGSDLEKLYSLSAITASLCPLPTGLGGSRWIPVDRLDGESRQAYRNVFCAAFVGSGVANPFTRIGDYSLSGNDIERATSVFDVKCAFEHDSEFIEGGSLARLMPSCRAVHVGHACGCGFGVDASDVFVNELWLVTCGLNASGLRDEGWHGLFVSASSFQFPVQPTSVTGRRVEENSPPMMKTNLV